MRISIIAAIQSDRGIGHKGQLLWRIPEDMARFRRLTIGLPVIMGRKTADSIWAMRGGLLPERPNIILTRNPKLTYEGAYPGSSVRQVIEDAARFKAPEIFFIGGAEVYEAALPFAEKLYLTIIEGQKPADAFFPAYEGIFRRVETIVKSEWRGALYRFIDLVR